MHILMTTDTVGGVWSYTRELVSGLVRHGHQVTLISFGKVPSQEQAVWMQGLGDFEYRATGFRLEWMHEAERDIEESKAYLQSVVDEVKPDLLHSNQFAYGALKADIPRIVVAHSDVVSWWVGVHKEEPPESQWLRWYREVVSCGLSQATAVVAPSQFMLSAVQKHHVKPAVSRVIHNGRNPYLFEPQASKDGYILAVGRVWDQAKQISLLTKREHPLQVWIVGSQKHPDKWVAGHAGNGNGRPGIKFYGEQSESRLRVLYAHAAAYAATSCYEPFGLAPLEAALSRCAVVANDIPTFQELWGDSAYYFRHNDADSLAAAIQKLSSNPDLRFEYGERAYLRARQKFTADQMVDAYERLYCSVAVQEAAA
ncbi:MAG TPA: glycosyltransferase family 4 protein [Terriglobales bacterium]|nr:glycosyltransferase family 4 protein [Terriglobales bacterium]